ncbi:MAG: leucyl aminopeptidase family protein, partial [Alphaproteobacteria bacterium]
MVPLTLLTKDELAPWLAAAPPQTAAWVRASGFKAAPGNVCLIPGTDGGPVRVLAG